MFSDAQVPIERFEWGRFTILGVSHTDAGEGVGKDIRLIGTEVTEWAERHGHDLKLEMITGVYGFGIDVLIIGNGVNQALLCPEVVLNRIVEKGISEIIVLPTPEACKKYNQLYRERRKVALLAHGTC